MIRCKVLVGESIASTDSLLGVENEHLLEEIDGCWTSESRHPSELKLDDTHLQDPRS